MAKTKGIALKNSLQVTRLISAFYYQFPEGFDYSGEKHAGWEFVYVESGKVSVGVEGATYILKKGEMVCHKPFEFHSVKPYDGKASVVIFCFEVERGPMDYFNNKILSINQMQKNYLNHIVTCSKRVFCPKDPLDIVREGAMDRSPQSDPVAEQMIKCAIELLILSLLNTEAMEKQYRVSLYEHYSQRQTLTKNIIAYLHEHLSEEVNLDRIAGRFSYSLSSIKRIFKEMTGYSIISYLINLRMQKAKEYLCETNLPIEDIATQLGYANIYYFSTAFKKKWGTSPSRYRAENRK